MAVPVRPAKRIFTLYYGVLTKPSSFKRFLRGNHGLKMMLSWPGGSLVGVSSCTTKGCGFDPQLGSIGEQPIDVSPPIDDSLSLKSVNTPLREDF